MRMYEWQQQHADLNEYDKLVIRMNTPRVVIDNGVCPTATLVKVDSAREHSIHLEAVQVLTDLNLYIKKAYISSDGRWFMDVFHVTDQNGNKLTDESYLSSIQQSLAVTDDTSTSASSSSCMDDASSQASSDILEETMLEFIGNDRQGLISEVFAVLTELQCSVVNATVWTHKGRIASVIYVKDGESEGAIEDAQRISQIEDRLRNLVKGDVNIKSDKMLVSVDASTTERRLHQMMYHDRDYERMDAEPASTATSTSVTVQNCFDRGYSVVNVQCRDRPKLLFDIVCTLTDMQYEVFHATINTHYGEALQEFYIRHEDGTPVSSEPERQRVIQCLRAAIERRGSEGVRLELRSNDRKGLLSVVTRAFRENGLLVTRADVSTTKEGRVVNSFYVRAVDQSPVNSETIEAVRQRIGQGTLELKDETCFFDCPKRPEPSMGIVRGAVFLSIGSLVRRNLYNLGLIKS